MIDELLMLNQSRYPVQSVTGMGNNESPTINKEYGRKSFNCTNTAIEHSTFQSLFLFCFINTFYNPNVFEYA